MIIEAVFSLTFVYMNHCAFTVILGNIYQCIYWHCSLFCLILLISSHLLDILHWGKENKDHKVVKWAKNLLSIKQIFSLPLWLALVLFPPCMPEFLCGTEYTIILCGEASETQAQPVSLLRCLFWGGLRSFGILGLTLNSLRSDKTECKILGLDTTWLEADSLRF